MLGINLAAAATTKQPLAPVEVYLVGLIAFLLLGIFYLRGEPPLVKLIHLLFAVIIGMVGGAILGSPITSPSTARLVQSLTLKLVTLSTVPLGILLLVLAAAPSLIALFLSRRGGGGGG
jgi:hypothetical protein